MLSILKYDEVLRFGFLPGYASPIGGRGNMASQRTRREFDQELLREKFPGLGAERASERSLIRVAYSRRVHVQPQPFAAS